MSKKLPILMSMSKIIQPNDTNENAIKANTNANNKNDSLMINVMKFVFIGIRYNFGFKIA